MIKRGLVTSIIGLFISVLLFVSCTGCSVLNLYNALTKDSVK